MYKTLHKLLRENKALYKLIPQKLLEERHVYTRKSNLRPLKNKFQGQTCVIIGNGPSLNKIDFVKLQKYPSFGVNGIFYKSEQVEGFKPTFYTVEDIHVMNDNVERINEYKCEYNFFPKQYKHLIKDKSNCYFINLNIGFYVEKSDWFHAPRFSVNANDKVYAGHSVTIANLQLAYYLGFKKVIMVGMDFNYDKPESTVDCTDGWLSTDDDVNHFHPDYFGRGKKWHDPKLDKVLKSYQLCKTYFEIDGREILNGTVGGKLELFKRVNFNEDSF